MEAVAAVVVGVAVLVTVGQRYFLGFIASPKNLGANHLSSKTRAGHTT